MKRRTDNPNKSIMAKATNARTSLSSTNTSEATSVMGAMEASELIVLAYYAYETGASSDAVNLLNLAFASKGMGHLVESLDLMNNQINSFVSASSILPSAAISSNVMDSLIIELSSDLLTEDTLELFPESATSLSDSNPQEACPLEDEALKAVLDEVVEPEEDTVAIASTTTRPNRKQRRALKSKVVSVRTKDEDTFEESAMSKRRKQHKANKENYKKLRRSA